MSNFQSRGEKILALLPKQNVPSDIDDTEDEEDDDARMTNKINTFFEYLGEDFDSVYQSATYDHDVELFPKLADFSPTNHEPNTYEPVPHIEQSGEAPGGSIIVIDTTSPPPGEEILPTRANRKLYEEMDCVTFDVDHDNNAGVLPLPDVIDTRLQVPQPSRSSAKPVYLQDPQPSTSNCQTPTLKKNNQKKKVINGKVQSKKGAVPKKTSSIKPKRKLIKKKAEFRWHRGIPFLHEVSQPPYVPPEGNPQILEPLDYFFRMFSKDMIQHIIFQSNLYATQEKNENRMSNYNSLILEENDLRDFLAVQILTGLVPFPSISDPWSDDLRFEKVAGIMPLNKYKQIKQILHFNDNSQLPSDDPYFKVRPLVEMTRRNFREIAEEQKYSVDEMMIPYKGTRAGSKRQYMKDKPIRWGLKLFVRSGVSGMTYDFFMYGGESTFASADFTEKEKQFGVSSLAVLALIKSIPEPALKFVFFDNYYSNPRLMSYLRNEYGILSLGTIRTNRFPGLEFKEDKELSKTGRGAYDVLVDNHNKLVAVKWLDNKPVHVVSSFCGPGSAKEKQRWSKQGKQYVSVECPEIIQIYNEFMGGVDLSGQLVSFYRTKKKSRKWYMCVFYHMIDMCINNAWLLYRRDFKNVKERELSINEEVYVNKKHMSLKEFRILLANQLTFFGRPLRGRPNSGGEVKKLTPPKGKAKIKNVKLAKDKNGRNKKAKGSKDSKHSTPTSVPPSIRFDNAGHIPSVAAMKGRCRLCTNGQTLWICLKCNSRLCVKTERNCFLQFHTKE